MISINQYYDNREEWACPRDSRDAIDRINGAKALGCMAIFVWSNGRIIYQAFRKDVSHRMFIKFAMMGYKLL